MPDPLVTLREQFDLEADGSEKAMPLPWNRLNTALGGGLRSGTLSLLVGEPGSAKSFLALEICLRAFLAGWTWAYWPLERDDAYAARRLLAVLVNRWSILDPESSRTSAGMMDDNEVFPVMAKMTPSIEPNPRQLRRDEAGQYYVPACRYSMVLERLRQLCQERALVILDPLSMLSFDDQGRDEWMGQAQFSKDAAAIVAGTRARLLLVHHTRKSSSGGKPRQPGLDEVAGAAALSRFADNVIFLEHHPDGVESEITTPDGIKMAKTHRRTLFVAKARDGKGTGWKVACDLGEDGPALKEWGFIQRKGSQ